MERDRPRVPALAEPGGEAAPRGAESGGEVDGAGRAEADRTAASAGRVSGADVLHGGKAAGLAALRFDEGEIAGGAVDSDIAGRRRYRNRAAIAAVGERAEIAVAARCVEAGGEVHAGAADRDRAARAALVARRAVRRAAGAGGGAW